MKKIKYLIILLISFMFLPNVVSAASGTISVTGSSTAVKGNSVTFTVTISSNVSMISWQADLDYDSSYLQLTSSTAESGGVNMASSSPTGTKSKSYTFTFRTLKTGSTTVKVSSYMAIANDSNFSEINLTGGSKSIKIMTQAELEATYSSDASLKSLTVDSYELSPAFNKTTYEYNVEVPNEITSVTITGTKNDANANVKGNGTVELEEGDNTFTINVVAQKGNETTYTIHIYRKELDPIEIDYNGSTYKIVRKESELISFNTFNPSIVTINDTEVPALHSDITDYTLVGVKDDNNNVTMYIYDEKLVKPYYEVSSIQSNIYPIALKENNLYKTYEIKTFKINDKEVDAYQINDNYAIIYALDVNTNKESYYLYKINDNSFILYDGNINKEYNEIIQKYKYIIYGMSGLIIVLLLIAIFKKGKKNKKNPVTFVNEIKLEDKTEKSEKDDDENKDLKEQKKLSKADKKIAKEQKKLLKNKK